MDTHLEMLTRILVLVGRADDGETVLLCWEGHWSTNLCTRASHSLNNFLCRLINDLMVIRLEADSDFLFYCH